VSKLGKKLIRSLEQMDALVRSGKPVSQSFVRRMKVKGKDVFVRETFTAPIKREAKS
jgi:hypothetical protein